MTEIGMIRDSDEMLRRHALAHALSAAGYPTAPATLATMATRGGGPRQGRPTEIWRAV